MKVMVDGWGVGRYDEAAGLVVPETLFIIKLYSSFFETIAMTFGA